MIVALEEAKYSLNEQRAKVSELGNALRIDELRQKTAELEKLTYAENFWNDQENSSKILQQTKQLKDKIDAYEKLSQKLEDAITLAEMAIEENDESYTEEVQKELAEIIKTEETMRLELLLSGEYDANNAILSFHPGAGGTEAQDWALMLYRMYTRWGEKHGYDVKLIDWLDGEEAGIKSATIMVSGTNAYGYLKSENGVHRLVRVSPFDASGRRHTSFASVEVMPEFKDDGQNRTSRRGFRDHGAPFKRRRRTAYKQNRLGDSDFAQTDGNCSRLPDRTQSAAKQRNRDEDADFQADGDQSSGKTR